MPVEQRKRDILVAAERLFAERGYEKVTMSDIAAEVGMSKKTLYANFSDKKSLLNELVAASLVWPDTSDRDGVSAQDAVDWLISDFKDAARHVLSTRHIGLCRLAIAEMAQIEVTPDILGRTGIAASRQALIEAIERIHPSQRVVSADSATLADMLFGATVAKPLFDALVAGVLPDVEQACVRIDVVAGMLFRRRAPVDPPSG